MLNTRSWLPAAIVRGLHGGQSKPSSGKEGAPSRSSQARLSRRNTRNGVSRSRRAAKKALPAGHRRRGYRGGTRETGSVEGAGDADGTSRRLSPPSPPLPADTVGAPEWRAGDADGTSRRLSPPSPPLPADTVGAPEWRAGDVDAWQGTLAWIAGRHACVVAPVFLTGSDEFDAWQGTLAWIAGRHACVVAPVFLTGSDEFDAWRCRRQHRWRWRQRRGRGWRRNRWVALRQRRCRRQHRWRWRQRRGRGWRRNRWVALRQRRCRRLRHDAAAGLPNGSSCSHEMSRPSPTALATGKARCGGGLA